MTARGPLFGAGTELLVRHFRGAGPYSRAASGILRATETGRCRLALSTLVLLELLRVARRAGRPELAARYRQLLESFPHLRLIPVHGGVADRAADLMARHRLDSSRAVHLATAMAEGASAFVCVEPRVARVGGLQVLRPTTAMARLSADAVSRTPARGSARAGG